MHENNQDNYNQSVTEYNQGMAALEINDNNNALLHFKRSLELHEHSATFYRIATTLVALGRDEEAEIALKSAYEHNLNNSQIATAYADMLAKNGNTNEAIRIINTVIAHNSTYAPAKQVKAEIEENLESSY